MTTLRMEEERAAYLRQKNMETEEADKGPSRRVYQENSFFVGREGEKPDDAKTESMHSAYNEQ